MRLREPGPHLYLEPVGQRGRQPQHKASVSQAAEPGRNHSSSSSESCCGYGFLKSSRDAAAVLNCTTPEVKVTIPKASRQKKGPCHNAWSSDSQLLKEDKVCLDQSGPVPKEATWPPPAAALLPSKSPTTSHSMRLELLEKAQAAKTEALQKAEIAAKLVAKAQCLATLAKADAGARLELQRSVSAAASSFHRDGTHQKSLSRTASVSQPRGASTRRVHSKTRAGAAAYATRQADQALSAGDDIPGTQQQRQQQRQQQQQPWVSALPKQGSSECSTMISALTHAHAGTKRSQEAACLPTAGAHHTPFKSRRVDFVLPSRPAQVGSCSRGHAFTSQAAEAAKAPAFGMHAHQAGKVCKTPALGWSSPCSSGTMDPDCQHGSSCHLQGAHSRPGLHADTHRQSSRSLARSWAGSEADVSHVNSNSSGSTTFWVEEATHHSAGLLLSGPCHAQQLDRQPSAHPGTSASAAALRQQHQLHMIDLMLARVSAAQEAIQLGLRQPHQREQHCKEQNDLWVLAESSNKLVTEMEPSTPGEDNFFGIESLLLQAECKKEELPVMGNCESKSSIQGASSVYRDGQDDMLEEYTERTHSSSGSSIDCPGLSFVPSDWLIDGNDEVDLGFFSAVPSDDFMLGLPLMPPSLQTKQHKVSYGINKMCTL